MTGSFSGGPDTPFGGFDRRRLLQGLAGVGLAAAAGSALSACGQTRKAQTQQGQDAQAGQVVNGHYPIAAATTLNGSLTWPKVTVPEPTSKVTITVSHSWDATFLERQKQFDKFFMERHPNIAVTYENTLFANYEQKYATAAAGGSLPDLMYMQYAWIQTFVRQGVFENLKDYIAKQTDFKLEDFTKPSTIPFKSNGDLYAVPYDCGPLMLFYNKALLKKSGIEDPTSSWKMDDLKTAATKIAADGGGKIWGLAGGPSPAGGDTAPPWLFPFGGKFVNDTQTACVINQADSVKAMSYWFDLIQKKVIPTAAQIAAVTPDPFTAGRAGFQLNGTWATPQLQTLANFDWAMAEWPAGPVAHSTSAEGSGYGITAGSKQKDAAWIYLNEYTSQAGMNFMWASTGRGSPARSSAWKYYTESKLAAPGAALILPALNKIASAEILYLPQSTQALNAASPIWDRVVAGKVSLGDGLNQIANAMTPILAKNAA